MEPSKRLWIVTLADVAVAFLLLLVLYAIRLALAVLAPEIAGWPLYILLPLGLALSVVGPMFDEGCLLTLVAPHRIRRQRQLWLPKTESELETRKSCLHAETLCRRN
jgi:hypothetical protein